MKVSNLLLVTLCVVACRGPRGDHGDVGGIGPVGPVGAVGPKGDTGESIVGPVGPKGSDGAGMQIVSFCTEETSYPVVFSEVGFCIGGKLYAVYSKNDGFLSLIPPGVYSSHGIHSTCTFIVSEGCQIIR